MHFSSSALISASLACASFSTALPKEKPGTFVTTTSGSSLPSSSVSKIAIWVPVSTILIQPGATEAAAPHELKREVVQGAATAQAPTVTQVSPITTIQEYHTINGAVQPVMIAYTQTFAEVPDQWPGPTQGAIGLGTIKGQVGITKTKRDVAATALPQPEKRQEDIAKRESNSATAAGAVGTGASNVFALAVALGAMIAF